MIRWAFLTVSDYKFFPGTLATINSIVEFHPETPIYVINGKDRPLSDLQIICLEQHEHVQVLDHRQFAIEGRYIGPWELKAYGCRDLCDDLDVIVGIDSDCLLCTSVDEEIRFCEESGGFLGGKDGDECHYDESYVVYGIESPAINDKYMSTSLYFCAATARNKLVLDRWSEVCSTAKFNGTGLHPGHGDQGVLNAILYSEGRSGDIHLLPNHLWSQHWDYWEAAIDFRHGQFVNHRQGEQRQRSFHCGGGPKFWEKAHRDRLLAESLPAIWGYIWFLAMFWFGRCHKLDVDPWLYLPPSSRHLVDDLCSFLPRIMEVYPRAHGTWRNIDAALKERIVNTVTVE